MKEQDKPTLSSPVLLDRTSYLHLKYKKWSFYYHILTEFQASLKTSYCLSRQDPDSSAVFAFHVPSCLQHFEQLGEKDTGVLSANSPKVYQLLLGPENRLTL